MPNAVNPLVPLLSTLSTEAELHEWLQVFLTDNERAMLAERLAIFRELATGASQREVAARIGCSVVTVTRGAKAYREHKPIIDRWLALVAQVQ